MLITKYKTDFVLFDHFDASFSAIPFQAKDPWWVTCQEPSIVDEETCAHRPSRIVSNTLFLSSWNNSSLCALYSFRRTRKKMMMMTMRMKILLQERTLPEWRKTEFLSKRYHSLVFQIVSY